jgi:hypothetical protein
MATKHGEMLIWASSEKYMDYEAFPPIDLSSKYPPLASHSPALRVDAGKSGVKEK